MTYYFRWDFEVCIRWTLYYPMRPQERIYQWQWCDATDSGRSHDNDNMPNNTSGLHSYCTCFYCIECTFFKQFSTFLVTDYLPVPVLHLLHSIQLQHCHLIVCHPLMCFCIVSVAFIYRLFLILLYYRHYYCTTVQQ